MSKTGSTALPQITFILHEEESGWWAEWPYMRYTAVAETRETVMQLCRDGVQIITNRPADHFTLVFVDDNQSDYWDGTPPLGGDSFDGR